MKQIFIQSSFHYFFMEEYYRKRAPEYEEIYYKLNPELQKGNNNTAELLKEYLKNRYVIEVACGTGYWTQFLSETAEKVVATDILEEVIFLAKEKTYSCDVQFQIADAYDLPFEKSSFNGALANFWFSHIPKTKIDSFLKGLHYILQPESRVFICDNNYIEEMGGPIISKENASDMVKLRTLSDGSQHQIIKNYYSIDELCSIFEKHVEGFSKSNINYSKYFWRVFYELK